MDKEINYKKEIAKNLLKIAAVKLQPSQPFTWASGLRSPIYCDNRVTLSYPDVRDSVKKGFLNLASTYKGIDAIGGVATAGIAHGALLAEALQLPYMYVRSSAKKHGRQNQIEGRIEAGQKILLIEDLISTGGSAIQAAEVLREAGVEIAAVLAIFTYNFKKAKDNFEAADLPFTTISDYHTLLEIATEQNYISDSEKTLLENWSADPKTWSDQFSQ